tara:strand:- start:5259 stop:5771 length:513 start_codon:yes stop_codon:yes gene_type:complete
MLNMETLLTYKDCMKDSYLHEVIATAIIIRKGKYLITRRSSSKKRFPGFWCVPGGHLEVCDYAHLPPDEKGYKRGALECALKREVHEEVGIKITNIEYVTSLATVHDDGNPSIVISCVADYASGEVRLQESETDAFSWVSIEEAKKYSLLPGIYDELMIAKEKRIGIETK